jgi:nucleotide-binding universal stress UspA family protein
MSIAKVLAPVTGGARDHGVLMSAIAAARPFDAHVLAYFVRPDISDALAFFTDGVSGLVAEEVIKATQEAGEEAAKRVRSALASACAEAGVAFVPAPIRAGGVTVSLREEYGSFGDRVTVEARLSDLTVFPPIREGDQAGLAEAFVQVLVETDRPVLRTTAQAPKEFSRIAIGWDGKTAAAAAVAAALPFLARAEEVEILSVQRAPLQPEATQGVREYLMLHGISSTERLIDAGSKRIGESLLAAAAGGKADLLVIGGYGSGRLRESLIGGVSRHVISHAELAVLMVH